VQVQLEDPQSMVNLYRKLLRLRRSSPALRTGSYRPTAEAPEDSYIYYRTHGDQTVLVALNFGGKDQVLKLADPRAGRVLLSTWLDREEQVLLGHCTLRAHEGIIVQLEPEPD
jgi:alpha-glucosidase